MPNCSCLAKWCWGCYGTMGFATSYHETWTILLQFTSPAPGGFACLRFKCLSGPQASQCCFPGQKYVALFQKAVIGFVFGVHMHVCV